MIVVVPVDPPRQDLVLSSLVAESSLDPATAVDCYEAAVTDVLRAVADSGGDLLVNYRDAETLPDDVADGDPEAEVRDLAAAALEDVDDVRFERQVGSSRSGRVGNTVTHLLEREDADSVAVLEPTAPLVGRSEIDSTAMALRRHDVVLGPSSAGETYLGAFTEPIDFTDAYASPSLATLARRIGDAGLDLGFAPRVPTIESESGLRATIAALEARSVAQRPGGDATAAVVDRHGLGLEGDGPLEW
ncbi:hypothetical protein [Halopiger goleimassiliensis]|uniref:hypothetical protein n=1 Tax=Halopiger goleimassiliensis TaxID=1293048 RepID=UPI000677DF5E|nr:hypothetical protein [Halopiger goleimassiliensis]